MLATQPAAPTHDENPASRIQRAWHLVQRSPRAVLAVFFTGYVLARVSILARFTVYTSYDTSSYAKRPGAADQVETLSFTGHSPRPWGAPLLYTLAGNDQARAVVQLIIGTIAWITVGYAVWLHLRSMSSRIVALILVFGLALTPAVYPWDYSILSESLSINLGLICLALFAIWVKTSSKLAITLMAVTGLWWVFTRQDVLGFVALLTGTLVVYAWRDRNRRVAAALAAAILAASMGWHAAILSTINIGYKSWGLNYTLSEATFLYRLRLQILPDDQVRAYYQNELGMPSCPEAERLTHQTQWAMRPFRNAYQKCPDLVAWADKNGTSSTYRYALGEPIHYTRTVLDAMPQTLNGPAGHYAKPVRLMPRAISRIYFPPLSVVLPWLVGLIVGALALGIWLGAFRRRRWLLFSGLAIAIMSLGNVAPTLAYTAGEYGRFGMQEAVFLRLGVILMVAAVVDAAVTRRDEVTSQPPTSPATSTPETSTPETSTPGSD